MEDKKNSFVFYLFNILNDTGKRRTRGIAFRLKHKTPEIQNQCRKGKKELKDLIDNSVSDDLNKLSHDIFYVNEQYEESDTVYTAINLSQKNQIETKFYKATRYNRDICGQEIDLKNERVLLIYQVFVVKILYVIYINNCDELENYIKKNDLKRKFDVLYKEFLKAIFGFKTKDDVLNFLFKKMLNTEHKDTSNEIDTMKQEISGCVDLLLGCNEKRFFVISDKVKAENMQPDKKRKYIVVNWGKDIGKTISLRQIKDVSNVIEKSDNQKFGKTKDEIENELLFSHKTLLSRLDKTNKNTDENLVALVEYYFNLMDNQDEKNIFEEELKYLENVIRNEVCSLKERFIVNNVLKEPWSTDESCEFDNFLQQLCDSKFITCDCLGMFKYKDKDGNLYTHNFVLKNLSYFFTNLHSGKKEIDISKLKIKPEYENDFKNIKIKSYNYYRSYSNIERKEMLEPIFLACKDSFRDEIVEEAFYSYLKFIPIEQLLKTNAHDNYENEEDRRYLLDFDRLNDINDEMNNIEKMVSKIMTEATIKNFGNDDELTNHVFSKSKLFEIVCEKLKDGTISIRSNNHIVIKEIFREFSFEFGPRKIIEYVISNPCEYEKYFAMCCNLVKKLCVKYQDESEFISYQLFKTMLDCDRLGRFRNILNQDSAKIVFQLDESQSYKFTAKQQIGFLRICTDKTNSACEESDGEERKIMICLTKKILGFMLEQHKKTPLNQKTLDYLFLNISDVTCLSELIDNIDDHKFNFNLGLNVVEGILNAFIDNQNENDSQKEKHLCKFMNCMILNNNINFISSDQKQNDEIKNAQEDHRTIRLNFIEMYFKKIDRNKKLISSGILNSIFKYFDYSLKTKKKIANLVMNSGLKFTKYDILEVLNKTKGKDKAELKKIFGVEMYFKSDDERFEVEFINSDADEDKRSCKSPCCDYGKLLLKTKDINQQNISDNANPALNGKDSGKISTHEIKITDSKNDNGKKGNIPPANSAQQESFFNWSIYFAIALVVFIVILFFVCKNPFILFALLAPIIIFVYRYIQRCKKNNPEREKPNLKTNEKGEKTSLVDRTQNKQNQDKEIILDEKRASKGYIDNLSKN